MQHRNETHNFSKLCRSIVIFFLNVRSVKNNFIYVFNLFSDSKIFFLVLSETWNESAFSLSFISSCPFFYSALEFARVSQNPLLILLFSTNLLFLLRKVLILVSNLFDLLFPLSNMVLTLFIAITYRSPSSSLSSFNSDLSAFFEFLYTFSFFIFFVYKNSFYTNKFIQLVELFNLFQHCHFFSHFSGNAFDLLIKLFYISFYSVHAQSVFFINHPFIQSFFLTTPLNSHQMSLYILALDLNLIKIFTSIFSLFLLLTLLFSLMLMIILFCF